MGKTAVKVFDADKEWINQKAEEQGVTQADVVAEAIEAYAGVAHHHRCPECDGRFTLDEIDPSTIQETGAIATDIRYLLRGRTQVKDFECPACGSRVTPGDAEIEGPVSTDQVSEETA